MDFGGFFTPVPSSSSCAIAGEEQDQDTCGWTETKAFESVDGVFSGAAKIPLGLTDYPLKYGTSYSLMGEYSIVEAGAPSGKSAKGYATLDLIDASGAMNLLIATTATLAAALAF